MNNSPSSHCDRNMYSSIITNPGASEVQACNILVCLPLAITQDHRRNVPLTKFRFDGSNLLIKLIRTIEATTSRLKVLAFSSESLDHLRSLGVTAIGDIGAIARSVATPTQAPASKDVS